MANYKVNSKSKTVSVSGDLTEIERSIIAAYITSGYVVKEKRVSTAARVSNKDILKYFEDLNDKKAAEVYEAKKHEKKDDKEIGFLGAAKWFKENYYNAYDEMMAAKENDKVKTAERRTKAAKAAADAYKEAKAAADKAEKNNAPELAIKKAAADAAEKYAEITKTVAEAVEAEEAEAEKE